MARKGNQFKTGNNLNPEDPEEDSNRVPVKEPKNKEVSQNFIKRSLSGVSEFCKRKNVRSITGFSFIFFSVFLLLAQVSYLFTWEIDQDKVMGPFWELVSDQNLKLKNWAGKMGGILSHKFIFDGFGVSSFLFIFLIFISGLKILFPNIKINLLKPFQISLFFIIWASVLFSFIFSDRYFFLGGNIGFQSVIWLNSLIGSSGIILLIGFSSIVFILLNFNISFSFGLDKNQIDAEAGNVPDVDNPPDNKQKNLPLNEIKISGEPEPENSIELYEDIKKKEETTENHIPVVELKETELILKNPEAAEKTETNEIAFEVIPIAVEKDPADVLSEDLVKIHGEYDPTLDLGHYQYPTVDLLENYGNTQITIHKEELEANKDRILETLNNYKIDISKIMATVGPTVTLYEIIPAPGVKISRIKNLEDDIALSLKALGIRIIAPIPGKGTIGIEVPNLSPEMVSMRSIINSEKFQTTTHDLPIALGKTISNEIFIADLAKMPHLLMAGATGQGKSVGLNAILVSLLYKKHPAQIKFVLVDPKKVELTLFSKIERHFLAKLPGEAEAIITDTTKVIHTLKSLCIEMDQRYDLLKDSQVRNLKEYNTKFINRKLNPNHGHRFLPYIVVVIDEFADLIITAGKEVETPIARLAQLARAIGIHLVIATQRPSVNIITGTIKANFPARIAFRVMSKIDSRTILDSGGADQLIGRGDMLLSTGNDLVRLQCAFVDTPEVERITEFIGSQTGYPTALQLPEYVDENSHETKEFNSSDQDDMFQEAARIVVLHQQGSASLLQRKLKLGYNRAGRIIDQLEAAGIIGPFEGSKARQVKFPDEVSLEQYLNNNPNS